MHTHVDTAILHHVLPALTMMCNHCADHFEHDQNNPLEIDALLVDEASMLDITLGCAMLRALPMRRNQFCQLVLVGAHAFLPFTVPRKLPLA